MWQEWQEVLGAWDSRGAGLGGWDLDVHHAYDPVGRVLYLGSGEQNSTSTISGVITTVAGTGNAADGFGDGGPATQAASLSTPGASPSGRKAASTSRIPTIPASAA